jgi:class 3 adenylate cyclase
VVDGPFLPANEQVSGYTVIDVESREEAMGWALRFPKPYLEDEGGEIEIRQIHDLDEFVQGPAVARFRALGFLDRIANEVGKARPDLTATTAPNGTVTILFTDIEGSTQLTERLGDKEWMRVLGEHNAIVRDQAARHRGFEVKSQGDGFMLAFASARDAIGCAMEIQRELDGRDGDELRVHRAAHRRARARRETISTARP